MMSIIIEKSKIHAKIYFYENILVLILIPNQDDLFYFQQFWIYTISRMRKNWNFGKNYHFSLFFKLILEILEGQADIFGGT